MPLILPHKGFLCVSNFRWKQPAPLSIMCSTLLIHADPAFLQNFFSSFFYCLPTNQYPSLREIFHFQLLQKFARKTVGWWFLWWLFICREARRWWVGVVFLVPWVKGFDGAGMNVMSASTVYYILFMMTNESYLPSFSSCIPSSYTYLFFI